MRAPLSLAMSPSRGKMNAIPADVLKRIVGDFGQEREIEVVQRLQKRLPEWMPNSTPERRYRCIVHLAQGQLVALESAIRLCLEDPRDLIVAAEYESVDGELVRRFDFTKPYDAARISNE